MSDICIAIHRCCWLQILTGDAFELLLYNCMQVKNGDFTAPIFFATFYFTSAHIALNLFIASVLECFAESEVRMDAEKEERDRLAEAKLAPEEEQIEDANGEDDESSQPGLSQGSGSGIAVKIAPKRAPKVDREDEEAPLSPKGGSWGVEFDDIQQKQDEEEEEEEVAVEVPLSPWGQGQPANARLGLTSKTFAADSPGLSSNAIDLENLEKTPKFTLSEENKKDLTQAFYLFDADGGGAIGAEELLELMTALGQGDLTFKQVEVQQFRTLSQKELSAVSLFVGLLQFGMFAVVGLTVGCLRRTWLKKWTWMVAVRLIWMNSCK